MKRSELRLICSCGTIWPVCEMTRDVFETINKINEARCPTCNKSSKTAAVYMDRREPK